MAGLAPVRLRGRCLGVFGSSFGTAALPAPLLGTQVLDRLGETALRTGCAAVGVASAVGLLRVSRAADRPADDVG